MPINIVLISIVAAVALTACATTPVDTSEARPVSPDRILASDYATQRPGTYLVIIKRDAGRSGAACSSHVIVDGRPIADLAIEEKLSVYLTLGDHIISSTPNGSCGGGFAEASIVVRADRPTTLRIQYDSKGEYTIQPTAQ